MELPTTGLRVKDDEKGPVTAEESFRFALDDAAPSTLSPGMLEEGSHLESVVNFGTMKTTHHALAAVAEEEAEQEKALAAFASNLRKSTLEETSVLQDEDLRLMDELQRDNERLATLLKAANEDKKAIEDSVTAEKEELRVALKEAKTELQLLQASSTSSLRTSSKNNKSSEDSTSILAASAEKLRKELALASERDALKVELESTKERARETHRDLATQLQETKEALRRANEKKQDLEFELAEYKISKRKKSTPEEHSLKNANLKSSSLWEERCTELEHELNEERHDHEVRIQALRNEFKALRAVHEKHKTSVSLESSIDHTRRLHSVELNTLKATILDLESQLDASRQFWAPKLESEQSRVKQLEAQLTKARKKQQPEKVSQSAHETRDLRVRGLQVEIERLVEINASLEREIMNSKNSNQTETTKTARSIETQVDFVVVENKKQRLPDATKIESIASLEIAADALLNTRASALVALGASLAASRGLASFLEHQVHVSNQELSLTQKKLQEARTLALKAGEEAAESRRRAEAAETPPQVAVAALAAQVNDLERKQGQRKAETERAVNDAKSQARLEIARIEARHRDQLAAKDQQLARFRLELDKLLDALRLELSSRTASKSVPAKKKSPAVPRHTLPQHLKDEHHHTQPATTRSSNASETPSDPGYKHYLQALKQTNLNPSYGMPSLVFDDRPPAYDELEIPAVSPEDHFHSFPQEPLSSI